VIVSTYQSVSGTGQKAIAEMDAQRAGDTNCDVYPYPIDKNLIPHIDVFLDNGYTKEEMKMVLETKKIMRDEHIDVSPTCVRVPVSGGHSESIYIETIKPFELPDIVRSIADAPGVTLVDDVNNNVYPMPLYAKGKDDVFVGRIRKDISHPQALNCWVVADNLRKGAALNAVQIAEYLLKAQLV
jgi:aspartate-semialdehyde dehydrogenase